MERLDRVPSLGQRVAQRRGRRDPRHAAERCRAGVAANREHRASEPGERLGELAGDSRDLPLGEHVARKRIELARAHGHSEELLRDIGQLMRLVDDHGVCARQQLAETRPP